MLGVPTNALAFKSVERLHKKGFDMRFVLHVVAEQIDFDPKRAFCRIVRINDYEQDDGIGIIVGTVQLLSRIGILHDNARNLFMKPPLLFVVIVIFYFNILDKKCFKYFAGR